MVTQRKRNLLIWRYSVSSLLDAASYDIDKTKDHVLDEGLMLPVINVKGGGKSCFIKKTPIYLLYIFPPELHTLMTSLF
jgi:hypothetical protein